MEFTVVLLRPESISEDRKDIYIAFMKNQNSAKEAIKNAQVEAWREDSRNGRKASSFEDYTILVMFYGAQKVAFYWWQV